MDSSSSSWRPLPTAAEGLPALLVSTRFAQDSYTVHVTDLAHIWSETLDRKALCRRALNEDTSIDPTDSAENRLQLLSRIRSAVDPSHPDHHASRAALTAEPSRDAGDDGLTLRITCDIPDLQPLKWPVYLRKAPASSLATELVLPLAQASLARKRQVDSLLEIIQQKDAVMAKLLDKLEATGTRLEHIFTVLSAKQKATRGAAEDKIKGLASFQRDQWSADLIKDEQNPKDTASLADAVFGDGLDYDAGLEVFDSPALDEWWKTLKGDIAITRAAKSTEELPTRAKTAAKDDDDEDDDFQVQATPPHLSSPRKAPPAPPADDASTEDEEKPPTPKKKKTQTKLGAIGKKKKRTPTPPPAPAADGSETESESDNEPTKAPSAKASSSSPPPPAKEPSPETSPPKPATKKGGGLGLGRIGGGAAKKAPSKTPEPEAEPEGKPPARKLGQIGRKPAAKAAEASEDEDGPRGRGRGQGRDKGGGDAQKPRETSEDRANRKREELQRDLERKAAAGPARKKRKF